MKIRPMGAELFRKDRKTDGRTDDQRAMTKLTVLSTIWPQHQINCEGKNVEFVNLKYGGTYSYHRILKEGISTKLGKQVRVNF